MIHRLHIFHLLLTTSTTNITNLTTSEDLSHTIKIIPWQKWNDSEYVDAGCIVKLPMYYRFALYMTWRYDGLAIMIHRMKMCYFQSTPLNIILNLFATWAAKAWANRPPRDWLQGMSNFDLFQFFWALNVTEFCSTIKRG